MKYFGGCDVGSTYTKAIIIDEEGKIVASTTMRSNINSVESAEMAMAEVIGQVDGISQISDLTYLIGTGYGRNKVPQAHENISEISLTQELNRLFISYYKHNFFIVKA